MGLKDKLKGKKIIIIFIIWFLLLVVIGNKMFDADPQLFDDRYNLHNNRQYVR